MYGTCILKTTKVAVWIPT